MIPGITEATLVAARKITEGFTIPALQVFGTLVLVSADNFARLVNGQEKPPVVVRARRGFLRKSYVYLTSFQGLAFCAKSRIVLELRPDVLLIEAQKAVLPV